MLTSFRIHMLRQGMATHHRLATGHLRSCIPIPIESTCLTLRTLATTTHPLPSSQRLASELP